MAGQDLTTGPVGRLLLRLTVPILVSTTLQSVYAVVGLVWVGMLGEAAVGGLSIGLQVFFVVLALSQVVATTALADLSQDIGAGRKDEAGAVFAGYLVVSAVLGSLASVAAWFLAPAYVAAFAPGPEVLAEGIAYFRASAPTFLTQLLLLVLVQGLRAAGDFTGPLRISIATVLLNLVLDPVLMFGAGPIPAMGIAGIGVATLVCQGLAVAFLLGGVLRPGAALPLGRPRLDAAMARALVTRGLPSGLQFLLLSVAMGAMLYAMKPFGPAWTAAAGAGFRLLQQAILPMVACATAAAAIAGQNAGAGHPDRVRRTVVVALRVTLGWAVVAVVIAEIAAPWLAARFVEGEGGPAEVYLHRAAPSLFGFAVSMPATFVLQALKRPTLPLAAAVARVVLLGAVAAAAGPTTGVTPELVFLAFSAGAWLEAALDLVVLRRALPA
jgi:putative MATE family efflux protein